MLILIKHTKCSLMLDLKLRYNWSSYGLLAAPSPVQILGLKLDNVEQVPTPGPNHGYQRNRLCQLADPWSSRSRASPCRPQVLAMGEGRGHSAVIKTLTLEQRQINPTQ